MRGEHEYLQFHPCFYNYRWKVPKPLICIRAIDSKSHLTTSLSEMSIKFVLHLLIIHLLMPLAGAQRRGMTELLERAIERTKEWQSTDRDRLSKPILTQTALRAKATQPIRVEQLDVRRLNELIKSFDRAWVLPKMSSKEPVGSNFQYKKTCEALYRARNNACMQPGFGIMCFNFCYEKGEKLAFICEDASDSNFCTTNNGDYANILGKYKRDPYKAKAYIHQQLSRCYLSAICNGALLMHSIPLRKQTVSDDTPFHMRAMKRKKQRIRVAGLSAGTSMRIGASYLHSSTEREGTSKRQRHTASSPSERDRQRSVPFWRRLLVRTTEISTSSTTSSSLPAISSEEDREEEMWLEKRFGVAKKAQMDMLDNKSSYAEERRGAIRSKSAEQSVGFWNKFQPDRWFQSIHHITHTG